ncbi:DUF4160 domain-containing protein [Acinetobacter variabilis]|uniref:DUF4160 domain-containing protein n=1 Tax=Acinetobacter variabilis TaxID=70346 RepID=UPI002FD9693B
MYIQDSFKELQRILAQKDLITQPKKIENSKFTELLLVKNKNLKYKIYQEQGHSMPHIHIDYNEKSHVASYSLLTGERLVGSLNKKYDKEISDWILKYRPILLEVWRLIQNGNEVKEIIGELKSN